MDVVCFLSEFVLPCVDADLAKGLPTNPGSPHKAYLKLRFRNAANGKTVSAHECNGMHTHNM
jgi:hypothetical protein